MTHAQERRSPTAGRVPLETLVEICGNEPGIPAFEAEALDVSAQGMHLRTAYLPEEGAPLVCRFEDHGREIVVEGVVAWRKESSKGGDFGVAFTALDSRSVDALRALVKAEAGTERDATGDAANGSRVRLHIEGLGSPMKARIRSGGVQKVQVGSSLEFLRVGRKLEIEDLDGGGRRSAQIDGVEVVVDARTSVPQLVVALRYEGVSEDTPQPTVTDLGAEPVRAQSLRIAPEAVTTSVAAASDEGEDPSPSGDVPEAKADAAADDEDEDDGGEDLDDDVSEALPAATRAARRVGSAVENAGHGARDASLAAVRGMSKLFAGASAKLAALREGGKAPAKRRTAKPVEAPASLDGKRLRPQSGKGAEAAAPSTLPAPKPHKRVAIGIALVAVAASASAIALRPAKVPSKTVDAVPVALGTALPSPAAPSLGAGSTALATGVVPLPGAALGTAPGTLGTEPGAPVAPPGSPVTANVPLFGPTPLATVEPAPLGPPPSGDARGIEALEQNAAKAVAPAVAADEEFPEPIEHVDGSKKGESGKALDAKNARPEDVPAWGKGKLHTPTIHRLRLDGPGAALHGVSDATGFTVLVPGRKLMEEGGPIVKRDSRIGRARTTNTPGGAQVRITFRETLPAYRVRLRRDYVEILISAAEEPVAKKATKEAPKPSAAKPAATPGKVAAKR